MTFQEKTLQRFKNSGLTDPNEMQSACWQAIEQNQNTQLISTTGSGKTLAFLTPWMEKTHPIEKTQILVIAPARELVIQIAEVARSINDDKKILATYGGTDRKMEQNKLFPAPEIVVGTPGRLADHLRNDHLDLSCLTAVVLDEFDKTLELGFLPDVQNIFEHIDSNCTVTLTSATELENLPPFLKDKNWQTLVFGEKHVPQLKQFVVRSTSQDKLETLVGLVSEIGNENTIVFCNHREAVDRISELLKAEYIPHITFHGGMKQDHREKSLIQFKNGSARILLCTDLAARGLDIPEIKNVVHYQIAQTADTFIHRSGRTARMEKDGNSYSILKADDSIPEFIPDFSEYNIEGKGGLENPPNKTIFINAGKKHKISKIDVVGLFLQKGGLDKSELGKIDVLTHYTYVAVPYNKAEKIIAKLKREKIKKQKVLIALAR